MIIVLKTERKGNRKKERLEEYEEVLYGHPARVEAWAMSMLEQFRTLKGRQQSQRAEISTQGYHIFKCLGTLSNRVASILLWIIDWVILCLVSSMHIFGVFQGFAIVCWDTCVTCKESLNWALVKSCVQWFNRAKAGSRVIGILTSVEIW